jgi:hypothetical protein
MQFRRLGEITEAIRVESANLVATVRIFAAAHPEIAIDDIRKTLWLVYPAMMAVAVETQEELQIGAPVAAPEAKTPKRVAKGLGDEERVLAYIERAGPNGIPAYDIVTKCAGKIDREQVERIGEMLEQSGLVFSEMVRPSFVGRKGLRFFSVKHGKPNITARGELVAR